MSKILKRKLEIQTRGDTHRFAKRLLDANGEVLTLNEGDELYFTVKVDENTEASVIQKTLTDGGIYLVEDETSGNYYVIKVDPTDTDGLDYDDYFYDLEIVYSDGEKITIETGTYKITDEATWTANEA